jgi:G:T-mismatch repair DNA endonuclease (very short patch repair protein)
MAFDWLAYVEHRDGIQLRHGRNGSEVHIGPYSVDGYHDETRKIFEFNGCYHHGHDCELTDYIEDEKWLTSREQRYNNTMQREAFFKALTYDVETIWECQYLKAKEDDSEMQEFISSLNKISTSNKRYMTQDEILNEVRSGSFFGCVECDISTPDDKKEMFSEMAPIFKNTTITFNDIGEHMQQYVKEHPDVSSRDRRCLIGSLFGEKILLATPLLKWLLDHGLQCTHIYQTVEWASAPCFHPFMERVADARRQGDVHPSKSVIAETMKLLG